MEAIERARDALNAIPAGLGRDDWHKVGRAAIAAGIDVDELVEWSSTGANFKSEQDVRAAFRNISPEGGTSERTLYKVAIEHGWTDPDLKQPMRVAATPVKPKVAKPVEALAKPRVGMSAAEIWDRCTPATTGHPYIIAKGASGVPLNGLRVVAAGDPLTIMAERMEGSLVVPCVAADGTLSSLQFITPPETADRLKANGKPGKLNLPGHPVQGWFTVGTLAPGGNVYICEGIGTAWACWQATGSAAVVCFGSGNMGKIAHTLRQQDSTANLVIVPDTGKEADAIKVASVVSGKVAAMPDGWEQNSDVNDLMQRDGLDALANLLASASEPPKPPPLLKPVSVGDVLANPAPPPQFIWDGYLPRGVVALMGAHGGTGKSTIALMLGVCAALGRPLFGVDTVACKVVFVSLEDGANIVRHRLAGICRTWGINPQDLQDRLFIVDGTENPELFSAETRGAGDTTATYAELHKLVEKESIGLVLVDNASDAYGGDEIQRRQVRAFMRSLVQITRLTNPAVMLLAHVDKNTSRNKKAEGGEGYSGSTAWHNSARSRLFLTRTEDGTLTLEHQKSNLSKTREPLTLEWLDGGLPQLVQVGSGQVSEFSSRLQGRAEDEKAAAVLKMIAEFESRQQYCSPAVQARNNVHSMLKSEPAFLKLKLKPDDTKRIVNQCQRAKWLEPMEYRGHGKLHQRWTVTLDGRLFADIPSPHIPTSPHIHVKGCADEGAEVGCPTPPHMLGGTGGRARLDEERSTLEKVADFPLVQVPESSLEGLAKCA